MQKAADNITNQQLLDAMTALAGKFDGLTGKFNSLAGRVDGLTDRVDDLTGKFNNMTSTVNGLTDKFDNLTEIINGISDTVIGIAENMATKKDLAALDTKVDNLELWLDRRLDAAFLEKSTR